MSEPEDMNYRANDMDKLVISPEVHPDRRVTFRHYAPDAQYVYVVAGAIGHMFGAQKMRRDEKGVWSVTIGPLEADIYDYGYSVDGELRTIDSANCNIQQLKWGSISYVEVPGDVPAYYEPHPVPHGDVRIHWYESAAMNQTRRMYVYTPPGYDDNPDKQYPVLYLLHGAGQDETGWTFLGRANLILDNLLAEGQAEPMLIVMPYGHVHRAVSFEEQADRLQAMNHFEKELLDEVIPFIETHYRVLDDRDHRALAGLSMGARQTLTIGLNHLDRFSYLGVFSGPLHGIDLAQLVTEFGATGHQLHLLWAGCSESERLYQANQDMRDRLLAAGIPHVWMTGPGGHSWVFWRPCLHDFAPRLFHT